MSLLIRDGGELRYGWVYFFGGEGLGLVSKIKLVKGEYKEYIQISFNPVV